MESDSSAPATGAPSTDPVSSDIHQAPGSDNVEKSSTQSTSGATRGGDAKSAETTADDAEGSAPNGTANVPVEAPDAVVQSAGSADEVESEVKDSTAPLTAADNALAVTNGTPSTSKKSHNGKRKSTGGVPEHKMKKINKKKSLSKMTHLDAKPGEFYFARLKSYPPWPAVICDEGMLPHSLLSTRPVTTKQVDGTYKEAYDDGGKRAHERTFPIMFLHTNEFAWLPNTELSELDPEECKTFSEKGKSKSLIQAYHVAAEGHDLDHFKSLLLDHQKAMQDDQAKREAREAAKVEKAERAEKKKRKSLAADDDEDVDMEDAEEEGKVEPKKSSKKRKKDAESDGDDEKPAKTPKTATKLKLTTPKAPGTGEKKGKESAKASAKASKPKSERKKSKAAASDEEVADEEIKEPEKELDPAEAKAKKEKEVLFLRHKLQKGFLSRDQAPQESDMSTMSNFITKLENYGDLEVSIIRSTKINKVLKALIKLNTIPKDEEFNFKSRSVDLLGKWNKALGAESTADETAGTLDQNKDDAPTTNGLHKDDKESSVEKKDTPIAAADLAHGDDSPSAAPEKTKDSAADAAADDEREVASSAMLKEAGESAQEVKNDVEPAAVEAS